MYLGWLCPAKYLHLCLTLSSKYFKSTSHLNICQTTAQINRSGMISRVHRRGNVFSLWFAENSLLDVDKSIFSLSEYRALRKESWSESEENEMWMTLGKNDTHQSNHVCLLNVFNYIYPTTLKKYHSDICLQSHNSEAIENFLLTTFRDQKFSRSPASLADFCIYIIFLPQNLVLKISLPYVLPWSSSEQAMPSNMQML